MLRRMYLIQIQKEGNKIEYTRELIHITPSEEVVEYIGAMFVSMVEFASPDKQNDYCHEIVDMLLKELQKRGIYHE